MEKVIFVEDAVYRDTLWNAAIDLKKENDELKQRIDELTQQLNAANERIKRLESVENSHAAVLNAIDNWIQQYKAKEAKP